MSPRTDRPAESTAAFIFHDGSETYPAHDLVGLIGLCKRFPSMAIHYLMRGDFEKWLDYIGRDTLSRRAREASQLEASDEERLKRFIESCTIALGEDYSQEPLGEESDTSAATTASSLDAGALTTLQQNLTEIADNFLDITRRDKNIKSLISTAKKEFESAEAPAVQLYGISQAGKSTLLSCLTLGEQYIPVGTGKATTAVKVELVHTNSLKQHRAEIEWFSPAELWELIKEPLDYYIKVVSGNNDAGLVGVPSSITSSQRTPKLASARDRKFLWTVLKVARRARQHEVERVAIGGGNDLAVAEVILRHYENYERASQKGARILRDFSQLPQWTRQPYEWGNWEKRSIADYSFDDLKSFFTKRVRLHISTHEVAEDLRILDTPGFGITNLHDNICRAAQREAEAVILILGQQLTQDQMEEIQQLTHDTRENLFVIWNPKDTTKLNAQNLLEDTLVRLKEEANVTVQPHRAVVANLHLALRAMQWEKLKSGESFSESTAMSLEEMFGRKYGEQDSEKSIFYELRIALSKFIYAPQEVSARNVKKVSRALELSGWDDVVNMLESIKASQQQRRATKFAIRLLDAVILYLESFPSNAELAKRNEVVKILQKILAHLGTQRGDEREELEKKIEKREEKILDEFLSFLTDAQEIEKLKSSVKGRIDSASHYSVVPGQIEHLIKDYANTRCAVWAEKFSGFATVASKDWVLAPYTKTVFGLEQWINGHNLALALEFPSASLPKIDLEGFRRAFRTWMADITTTAFTPDWLEKFVTWVQEGVNEVIHTVKRAWWRVKTWFTEDAKPPAKKPSFDKRKAYEATKKTIETLFSKSTFESLYEVGKNPDLVAIDSAPPAARGNEDLYDILAEIQRQVQISTQQFLVEKCEEFYEAWRKTRESIKEGVNVSLTAWSETIGEILEERRNNLKTEAKPVLEQESLVRIENLISQLNATVAQDGKDFHGNLSKVRNLIAARKLGAQAQPG